MVKIKKQYIVGKPDYTLMNPENPNQHKEFYKASHYIQHELMPKQLSKAVVLYAKNHADYDHKLINLLSDCWLTTAGKYAHMINEGAVLPEDIQPGLDRLMGELTERALEVKAAKDAEVKVEKEKNKGPVLTVQDRMRMQAEGVGAVFDEWLDDLMSGKAKKMDTMDPVTQLKLAEFKAGQARWITNYYTPELELVKEVLGGKDEQLNEGYNNVKRSCLLRVSKLLESILTAASMVETVSKAQRKTRKKKLPSVAKQVANIKYCVRHDETGVASVSPAEIVGAQEVWVYNVKTRKLGKYVAQDAAGLSVKGTTIKDFATTSVAKNLRKPKEQLKDFMKAGKVKLRKFLDEIKAVDVKMTGRLNKDVVILRIVK